MPWARFGDNIATYPDLLEIRALAEADDRLMLEALGFLTVCATLSAGHKTDYLTNYGTALQVAGPRADALIGVLVAVGLVTPVAPIAGRKSGFIIRADSDFIHVRTRDELEAEKANRQGRRSDRLKREIRLRDGDNCRWCGIVVHWSGTAKSGRHAEVDHLDLDPKVEATPENTVVACKTCNGTRGQDPEKWAREHELLPPPPRPLYGRETAQYLQRQFPDRHIVQTHRSDETSPVAAAADPARQQAVRPAAPDRAEDMAREVDEPAPKPQPNLGQPRRADGTGSPGTGRDGTGMEGKGRAGPDRSGAGGAVAKGGPPRKRRGKRGGRGRRQ
ncbi:hypothetical protein GCM10010401_14110 [Rarobacter faecitabidus]|uniref:HNH endonuclease n=1 Tax=Rarobacter faecitabidus TaxID=13243 RepID=A0A542ZDX2_RARFA|nr:hypothetical protein [Rarobacter faecitabidus]TQL58543.1 hypothetical protein FB461_1958 [Rarobacter faecitabidus]